MIVTLDKYLSELLYLHDCVIIPDFGGFVANYSPASIHPTQHTMLPPSKKIAFNKKLQNNDGLLAAHIASSEKVSYSDALQLIAADVAALNAILKNGQPVLLPPTGKLFYDIEKNLQFEAGTEINYLLDAFGLVEIQSPAIKRDTVLQRLDKEFQDRPALASKIRSRKFPWKVLIPIPFIALAIWGSMNTDALNKGFHMSGLNPFVSGKTTHESIKSKAELPSAVVNTVLPALPENDSISTPTPSEEPQINSTINITEPVHPVQTPTDKSFFIIAGCFKEPANADNMLRSLKTKGFDPFIKGKNEGGLIMVCYKGFDTKEEAVNELAKIHLEIDKDAWICMN
jgi:cell division septation protein DedD